jgi:hypothetical protein
MKLDSAMFETTQPSGDSDAAARQAHRDLTTILRIGAVLLGSGASTNDVETTMMNLSQTAGLEAMQTTVISGLVSVSWDPGLPGEPITMIRVVRQRLTEYDRLANVASVVNRLLDRELAFDARHSWRRAHLQRHRRCCSAAASPKRRPRPSRLVSPSHWSTASAPPDFRPSSRT